MHGRSREVPHDDTLIPGAAGAGAGSPIRQLRIPGQGGQDSEIIPVSIPK